MTVNEIKALAEKDYMFEWGGMKIDPYNHGKHRPEDTEETHNDNSTLISCWWCQTLEELGELKLLDIVKADLAVKNITLSPGHFTRYPKSTLIEAHDNYAANILISIYAGDQKRLKAIVQHGKDNWGNYNDQPPEHQPKLEDMDLKKLNFAKPVIIPMLKGLTWVMNRLVKSEFGWHLHAQRQPGTRALYKIAAQEEPSLFSTALLAYGTYQANVINLSWTRNRILELSMDFLPFYKRWLLQLGINRFNRIHGPGIKNGTFFDAWLKDPNHPLKLAMHQIPKRVY